MHTLFAQIEDVMEFPRRLNVKQILEKITKSENWVVYLCLDPSGNWVV
jgi:hypothetical protein